jgi:hypothetical protein
MKFRIDIDCTPEEARTFFGLPDVAPLQESLMSEVETRLRAGLDLMDPESLMKAWVPAVKGWEELMKAMVSPLSGSSRKED